MGFNLSSFRRITNSGNFIPEIDGLRFIAILMVIIYHLDGFLFKELVHDYKDNPEEYSFLHNLFLHGYFGVEIFFTISAFVVALPFAKYYLAGANKIQLSDYFFRRLTRIEPPYVLSLFIILAGHLYLINGEKFSDFTPSFYYSLFYGHGFFYHRDFQPLVNNVCWSLEIEIQFYILAPLIFYFLFRNSKNALWIIIFLCLGFSIATKFPKPEIISLYEYFHYFLIGITIAFMKAKNIHWNYLEKINQKLSQVFVSILAFIIMNFLDITFMGPLHWWFKIILSSLQIFFIFVVFYNLLISNERKLVINRMVFTVIGGMCYSIYLFHNQIIMLFGHLLLKSGHTAYFILDYVIVWVLLSLIILTLSSIFYVIIERPCMDRYWPQKLIQFIKYLPSKLMERKRIYTKE